jgi:NAD(P)-dependent dehydrogenase (short-subunit alcohol dehydrogenase family)
MDDRDIPDLTGKRVIVTGASAGIGWHMALEPAHAGAEVTIAARDEGKTATAADRIRTALPAARIRTGLLDLARLASVRAFTDAELVDTRPIDLLVNKRRWSPVDVGR